MASDSAFCMGTQHDKCEDYAINLKNELIAISDGCSSSLNTDIGARIICECLKQHQSYHFIESSLMPISTKIAVMMGLAVSCLDSTLLMAYDMGYKVIVKTIGDGFIIIKSKDGMMHVLSMNYSGSAPFYMSYINNEERKCQWRTLKDNEYTIEYTSFINESVYSHPDFYDFQNYFPFSNLYISPEGNKIELEKKDIEWVALSSDGLSSFYEKNITETAVFTSPIDYRDVIKEFVKIGNTNGKFVQRRLNKFRKICEKNKWYNTDDVSLAVLVI